MTFRAPDILITNFSMLNIMLMRAQRGADLRPDTRLARRRPGTSPLSPDRRRAPRVPRHRRNRNRATAAEPAPPDRSHRRAAGRDRRIRIAERRRNKAPRLPAAILRPSAPATFGLYTGTQQAPRPARTRPRINDATARGLAQLAAHVAAGEDQAAETVAQDLDRPDRHGCARRHAYRRRAAATPDGPVLAQPAVRARGRASTRMTPTAHYDTLTGALTANRRSRRPPGPRPLLLPRDRGLVGVL